MVLQQEQYANRALMRTGFLLTHSQARRRLMLAEGID